MRRSLLFLCSGLAALSSSMNWLIAPLSAQAPAGVGVQAPADGGAAEESVSVTPNPGAAKPAVPVEAAGSGAAAEPGVAAAAPAGASGAAAPASGKISYSACQVEGPYVALTFDDGPHAQNTPRLLDLLKERKVRATFFVIGQNAVEYPELLKRTAAEGHELANHSYSHPILASLGEGALREQMEKTHQAVLKATGVTMRLMRPPYGALSEPQRRLVNAQYQYRVILWDVDPLDWKFRDASRVESHIVGHAKPGSIILAHDIHKSTVDAMAATIDALQAKGFQFVTVSELLAMDRPGARPAKAEGGDAKSVAKDKESKAKVVEGEGVARGKGSKSGSKSTASAEKADRAEKSEKGGRAGSEKKGASGAAGAAEGASVKKAESPEEVRQKWLKLFGR